MLSHSATISRGLLPSSFASGVATQPKSLSFPPRPHAPRALRLLPPIPAGGVEGSRRGRHVAHAERSERQRRQAQPEPEPEFAELLEDEREFEQYLELELESDWVAPVVTAHYEVVFLIHEKHYDEVPLVVKKFKEVVEGAGGTLWRLNDWGLRRLAYRIKKAWKANYILANVELTTQDIAAIDKFILTDERIIRGLVVRQKTALTDEFPAPPVYNARELSTQDEEMAAVDEQGEEGDKDDDDDDEWEEDDEDLEDEDGDEWEEVTEEEVVIAAEKKEGSEQKKGAKKSR